MLLASMSIALFMFAMRKKADAPADVRLLEMIDRLQVEMTGVKAELKTTQNELHNVQTYAARLAMQVIRLGGEPVTMADIEDSGTGKIHVLSRDTKRLMNILREEFSVDELDVIAFEIGIRRGQMGDGDIDSRAVRLMETAKNQGRLIDLAAIVWRERPQSTRS